MKIILSVRINIFLTVFCFQHHCRIFTCNLPRYSKSIKSKRDVAKHFIESVVDVSEEIEKLLTTNIPLIMTDEDIIGHTFCFKCNLY